MQRAVYVPLRPLTPPNAACVSLSLYPLSLSVRRRREDDMCMHLNRDMTPCAVGGKAGKEQVA
jgi:hypothetical protein